MRDFNSILRSLAPDERAGLAEELLEALEGKGGVTAYSVPSFPEEAHTKKSIFERLLERLRPKAAAADLEERAQSSRSAAETEHTQYLRRRAAEEAAAERMAQAAATDISPNNSRSIDVSAPEAGAGIVSPAFDVSAGALAQRSRLRREAHESAYRDEGREMQRVSDFFMRDSRRYDRGFERY